MQMSDKGLAELAGHEGIVTSRYLDSEKIWTIGVGHTAAAGAPDPRTDTKVYSVAEMMELFRRDVKRYEADVLKALAGARVSQEQFDALVSFHYNTGGIFKAALTASIRAGNYAKAADQFMGWTKPAAIISRRKAEQRLFRDGAYSNGGMATVYAASPSGAVQWGGGRRINALAAITETNGAPSAPPATTPAPAPVLRKGMKGPDVRAWQETLRLTGASIVADGDFGARTENATKDLQRRLKLTPDGVVGALTRAAVARL